MQIFTIFFFLNILIFNLNSAAKTPKVTNKNSGLRESKGNRRGIILKCCGKKSCIKPGTRLKQNVTEGLKTNSAFTPKDERSSTKETEIFIASKNNEELQSATYSDANPTTAFSNELESQSEEKLFSSTSSDIATTSTTTPPSTTTLPPSLADPIVEKCESSFPLNTGLFETNGRLKDPDKLGFWVTSCNLLFVFGKSLVTWRENAIKCASIGMQPIEIENDAKYQCFKQLAVSWKYGSNYWTSGLRTQGSKFSWCTKNGSSEMTDSVDLWAPGQPNNWNGSENCVHMNIKTENTTVYLTDKKCTNINVFSCQGPTTPPPPCTSPVCPNVTCKRNMSLYTNTTKEGKTSYYLAYPDMFGSWYKKNNRFYFYSYPNQTQTFLGAMKACCDLGMNLLSLQFDYKFDGVLAAVKERYANPGYYWTSGTDSGCESAFGFCAVKRLVRKESKNWQPGQPNNAGGVEHHLAVYINGSSALMADFNGDTKLRYICEARDTTKSASGGRAVRDECAAIFNVSMSM
ncbi:Hypothetical predicted protein [Cloeon dipterum]|uniref:C-type lectin domain-containing protein n=1 Tax=Cloeon dipterum TaxID=197152 RepID=A0A8S1CSP2_9INSE|nr:Hypothetical predicted protein [Cloeon dipterum]